MNARRRKVRRHLIRLGAVSAGTVLLVGASLAGYAWYVLGLTNNFHELVPGQVYRSGQPSAEELKKWSAKYGLRTVVNLRGGSSLPFYAAERRAADEAGVHLIDIRFSAIRLPPAPKLRRLIDVLETADRPILLHCRDGSDRAGVASVLAAMAVGGQDYEAAKSQLSARYLHFDEGPDAIAGILQKYEAHCRDEGVSTGGWDEFKDWALHHYYPFYYFVEIEVPGEVHVAAGRKATVAVRITNRSDRTIPTGDAGKTFTIAAFAGDGVSEQPQRHFGSREPLPRSDIEPGQSVTFEKTIHAPREPGEYEMKFDIVEEGRTWFSRQGSPITGCRLIVASP